MTNEPTVAGTMDLLRGLSARGRVVRSARIGRHSSGTGALASRAIDSSDAARGLGPVIGSGGFDRERRLVLAVRAPAQQSLTWETLWQSC